jgi:hypothetical protein
MATAPSYGVDGSKVFPMTGMGSAVGRFQAPE